MIQRRRPWVTALTVSCAALAMAACSSSGSGGSSSGSGKYKVFVIDNLTGNLAAVYHGGASAVQDYFKDVNAKGGINGKKVAVTVLDSQSTPTAALSDFRQAVAAKADSIVQMGFDVQLDPALPTLKGTGISVFSPGVPDNLLYPKPTDGIYMLGASATTLAQVGISETKRLLGGSLSGHRIAFIGLQTPFVQQVQKAIEGSASGDGFTVSDVEYIQQGIPSFTAQAEKVAKAKSDAVIEVVTGVDAPTISKALVGARMNGPIVASTTGGADAPAVFQAANNENYYALRVVNLPQDVPAIASKSGSSSGAYAYTVGWLAAATFTDAVKSCGDKCKSAADINAAIQKLGKTDRSPFAFGNYGFTATDHEGPSAVQFFHLSGGKVSPSSSDPIAISK